MVRTALVDFLRGPAADVSTAMQQNLEEPNDASVVDFDTGIADRTDGDRQRHPLQKREVDVNVEHWAWKPAKRLVMTLKVWRTASRLSNPFLRPKSLRLLEQSFIAQERCELFVLLQEGMLEVGAEDVMAMLDLIDNGGELAGQPAV